MFASHSDKTSRTKRTREAKQILLHIGVNKALGLVINRTWRRTALEVNATCAVPQQPCAHSWGIARWCRPVCWRSETGGDSMLQLERGLSRNLGIILLDCEGDDFDVLADRVATEPRQRGALCSRSAGRGSWLSRDRGRVLFLMAKRLPFYDW